MIGENYYLKNVNDMKLKALGYKYLNYDEVYVLRFPIEKYNNYTVLEGKIVIHADTGAIRTDVYTEMGEFYSQYYNPTNPAYNEELDMIHEQFFNKFKMTGIQEKKKRGRKPYAKIKSKKVN